MTAKQLTFPLKIVKKSNALCRARWHIESVYEPRLVALVASRVRKDDQDFQMYDIPVRELTGQTNDGGETYKIIESVTESLMNRILTLREEGSRSFAKYNVFSKCEYDEKKGIIRARFDPDLKPHYLGLKEKFTEYNLLEFLALPSIYSQRMFELLKSWDDKPEVSIDISELHEMLDVPESLKKNFAYFRRRVLEKAHKDITQQTTLKYEWKPIKKGRAIVAVLFIFSRKRSKAVVTEKQHAISKTNNKLFSKAVKCRQNKGGECKHDNTPAVCQMCETIMA